MIIHRDVGDSVRIASIGERTDVTYIHTHTHTHDDDDSTFLYDFIYDKSNPAHQGKDLIPPAVNTSTPFNGYRAGSIDSTA